MKGVIFSQDSHGGLFLLIKVTVDFMMGGAFVTNVAEKLQEICKKRLTQKLKSDILIFVGASL